MAEWSRFAYYLVASPGLGAVLRNRSDFVVLVLMRLLVRYSEVPPRFLRHRFHSYSQSLVSCLKLSTRMASMAVLIESMWESWRYEQVPRDTWPTRLRSMPRTVVVLRERGEPGYSAFSSSPSADSV